MRDEPTRYWLLKEKVVVIQKDRDCYKCGTERAIGERMTYRVHATLDEFWCEYQCFICIDGRRL